MSKVQCLKQKETVDQGGGVEAPFPTLFNVSETLIFYNNFTMANVRLEDKANKPFF